MLTYKENQLTKIKLTHQTTCRQLTATNSSHSNTSFLEKLGYLKKKQTTNQPKTPNHQKNNKQPTAIQKTTKILYQLADIWRDFICICIKQYYNFAVIVFKWPYSARQVCYELEMWLLARNSNNNQTQTTVKL